MRVENSRREKKSDTGVIGRGVAPDLPVLMECFQSPRASAEWLSPDEEQRLRPESFRLIGGKYHAEPIVVGSPP